MNVDEQLREAWQVMQGGQFDRGMELFMKAAWPVIERGIAKVLSWNSTESQRASEWFWDRKLGHPMDRDRARQLVQQVGEVKHPRSYLFRAARNCAVDYLRDLERKRLEQEVQNLADGIQPRPGREPRVEADEAFAMLEEWDLAGQLDDDLYDAEEAERYDEGEEAIPIQEMEDAFQEQVRQRVQKARAEVVDRLPSDKRVLFCVTMAEQFPLADRDLRDLARRRGVKPSVIRQELEQRQRWITGKHAGAQAVVERCHRSLLRDQVRQRWVSEIMRKLDPLDVEPAEELDLRRFCCNYDMWRAGARQRAAFADYIGQRLEATARRLQAERDRLQDLPLRSRRWKEVAQILGEVTVVTPPEEEKRIINNLTQKYKRLWLEEGDRLRALLDQEEAHDQG